tara:strand:+ start:318 stop:794 length:477 start_codon:yes stop_codon:yes gene_type:complete
MTKARPIMEIRPHKIELTKRPPYVYVCHIDGSLNDIISSGSMWKKQDIMKAFKTQGKQAGTIYHPFSVGDVFVHYFEGDILVVCKTQKKKGTNHPYFKKVNRGEVEQISKSLRHVERDLKWRKGSYCENENRKNWKPDYYRYTSNSEAEYYQQKKETG